MRLSLMLALAILACVLLSLTLPVKAGRISDHCGHIDKHRSALLRALLKWYCSHFRKTRTLDETADKPITNLKDLFNALQKRDEEDIYEDDGMDGLADELSKKSLMPSVQNVYGGNNDQEQEKLVERLVEMLYARGSMSEIEVRPTVWQLFNDMKLKSTNVAASFKIYNKKYVDVDEVWPAVQHETSMEEFQEVKNKLTMEPRYILFDFHFVTADGRKIKKMAFIFWSPENAKIGDKMIYASTKDTVKKAFNGLSLEFQANDLSDFDWSTFKSEVERKA